MNRRSFLRGLVAGVAAFLLPGRSVFGKVEPVALSEGWMVGLNEPCADVIALKCEREILYTVDGGYTWYSEDAEMFEMTDIKDVIREIIDQQEG